MNIAYVSHKYAEYQNYNYGIWCALIEWVDALSSGRINVTRMHCTALYCTVQTKKICYTMVFNKISIGKQRQHVLTTAQDSNIHTTTPATSRFLLQKNSFYLTYFDDKKSVRQRETRIQPNAHEIVQCNFLVRPFVSLYFFFFFLFDIFTGSRHFLHQLFSFRI